MALTTQQIQSAYVTFFSRPADVAGLNYWSSYAGSEADLYTTFAQSKEYADLFDGKSNSQKVAAVYQNLFGRAPEAEGLNYWTLQLDKGDVTVASLALAVAGGAQGTDADTLANRVSAATAFTQSLDTGAEILAYQGDAANTVAKQWLAGVTDNASLEAAVKEEALASTVAQMGGSNTGQTFTLTDGIDNIVGNAADNTISAPVVQNQNGELVNSLETGDVISGGEGTDTLNAVLTGSQGADHDSSAPAISATLSGVEVVNYRVQYPNNDAAINNSDIDAELHSGVQQYWSDNSRGDLQIEDVRQLPEELTFGMRQTDPGVSYSVYFDPAQLAADRGTAGDSSLTLTLVDNSAGANELENFPVNGVVFTLGGTQYTVQSDAMGEADTYAAFVAAVEAALAEQAALADVTVTLNANNTITLTDPAGATFGAVGYTWVGNIVPSGGELQWNQAVGAAVVSEAPITTDVVLDAVGRTSQGGTLDIGSMADGGVEVFNVSVDRSSWLTAMESRENFGVGDRHLETVNLTSIGANGDLAIGNDTVGVTGELDGRVVGGLTDVREVLNVGFTGELSYGVSLTDDAIGRYLDVAAGEVVFTYEGGAGNDNITIADDSTGDALSGDADFAMDVTLAAGDDRLNLDMANVDNVSVDGGEGANVIAVARSHGMTAANTFEGFANFQTYEVEGTGPTQHDFTSMAGVTTVNIATDGGNNTELRDLAADTAVVITGKNQTLAGANASNANQTFGNIAINGADATATDTTLRVTLQNTARLDGVLTVNQLSLGNIPATATAAEDVNPIRTLELVSAGQRNTENVVTDISAALVNTFNLSGTQDLTATITAAANSTDVAADRASLVVNGAELAGDLDLSIDGGVVSAADGGSTSTVTLTGTAGTADRLTVDESNASNTLAITTDTTVSGFETVRFVEADGVVDVTNFSGVTVYDIESTDGALTMEGMKGNERINVNIDDIGNVAGNDLTFVAAGQATSNVLDLEFRDADSDGDEVTDVLFATAEILVQDFRTISLDLGGYADQDEAYTFDLNLLDEDGLDDTDLAYDAGTAYARSLVVIGGGDQGDAGNAGGVDSVDLGTLTNVLSSIDLSGYVGQTQFILDIADTADLDRNVTVVMNAYQADITENDLGVDDAVVTYRFTEDLIEGEVVTIGNFDDVATVGISSVSVLDLSALGVTGFSDIQVDQVGADTVITSNDGLNFEIVLTGVTATDLLNDNFKFAA